VYYAQPPLIYSTSTGEKKFFEVPENFMIGYAKNNKKIGSVTFLCWFLRKFDPISVVSFGNL